MKRIAVFLMALSYHVSVFCDCDEVKENPLNQKIYISLQNLHLSDEGIFVLLNNDWQQINALYSDEDGYYVERQANPDTWYCPRCRTFHNCQENCPRGKPRPSKCDE